MLIFKRNFLLNQYLNKIFILKIISNELVSLKKG